MNKINLSCDVLAKKTSFNHFLLIMRTATILLFTCVFISVAETGHTQNAKVTLNKNKVNLKEVLNEIENQTDYLFIYNNEVNTNKTVSVKTKNGTVRKVLNHVLKDSNIDFLMEGNHIILSYIEEKLNEKDETEIEIVQQQGRTVTGRVTDINGESLPGVTVLIKGTSKGTVTDVDGNFTLSDISENKILQFSYVGMQKQDIVLGSQARIDVTMVEDAIGLEEVVAIGYGTMRKSDLTGSVQRLDASTFQSQSMTQLSEMFTGTVAGLNASQGARASGGASFEIRGPTSLKANTNPLIVLDGVIYNGSISDISPTDIESVDILKDASSAAVFGSRAASGVIIITTKKGNKGKPSINLSINMGIATETNTDVGPLNPQEYTEFRKNLLIMENPDKNPYYYYSPNDLQNQLSVDEWLNLSSNPNSDPTEEWLGRLLFYPDEMTNYLAGYTEDWRDLIMQTGLRQDYNISLNGGTDFITYYWSTGYTDNQGVQVGDEYSTFRSRINLNAKISSFLDIGVNGQFSHADDGAVLSNMGHLFKTSPYGSMYEADGSIKLYPHGYELSINPLENHLLQERSSKRNSLFGSIYTEIKLPFNFSYKISYQPRLSYSNQYNFWNSKSVTGGKKHSNGYGTRQEAKNLEWMLDNIIRWSENYGEHNFDFTFLYNTEKFQAWTSNQEGENFSPSENLSFHGLQFASNYSLNSNDSYSTADALMARLNYNFKNKYLLTLSFRRDGFSAFGQNNKRSDFPSLALGWIVSDEKFFNRNFVNLLKIRASWGSNGNRDIGRYSALARLDRNIYSDGSNLLTGIYNTSLANPNLKWERTEAYNLGLDFGLLNGKISGDIDLYSMLTRDLLIDRRLPQITGFNNISTNLGKLQNRGLELTLNTINIRSSNFQWKSNLVFSLNRNEILSLYGDFEEVEIDGKLIRREVSDITNEWFIGQAIDRVWDYNMVGVWQIEEKDEAAKYGLQPGDYKPIDVNGDKVYSATDDKQFIGYREPRYRIGLRNTFEIGDFSASFFLRSDLGHIGSIADFKHTNSAMYDRYGMRNIPYWSPTNPTNKYGSLTANQNAYGGGYNIYFDRSFLRIQDITLSYNLPLKVYRKIGFQKFQIVGSIRNLYCFNKWEHWDPESKTTPMPRIFTIGINLTL